MRKLILIGSLVAATAIPALASAEVRCARGDNGSQVTGAIVGGLAGAAIGSSVAGRGAKTEGGVLGGVLGAVIGSQVAKGQTTRCPDGYRPYDTQQRRYIDYPAAPPPPVVDYRRDFWQGGPSDVRQRIDFMEERIRRSERNRDISRREANDAYAEIVDIRRQDDRLNRRDRGLNRQDVAYLQDRLDRLGERLRWMRATDDRRDNRRDDRRDDRRYR